VGELMATWVRVMPWYDSLLALDDEGRIWFWHMPDGGWEYVKKWNHPDEGGRLYQPGQDTPKETG
jgi:hypothetical protein